MFKSTIKYLVITGLAVNVVTMHAHRHGLFAHHNAMMRHMQDFWRGFDGSINDGFMDQDWPNSFDGDSKAIPLPDLAIEQKDDTAMIVIKGLTAKDDEIKAVNESKKDYVQYTFPYQDSKVTLVISPRSVEIEGLMVITQEKKDPKGKVLSSSSYDATNFLRKSLPFVVDVEKAKKEYKNGVLTITLPEREELVALPRLSVKEENNTVKLEIKGVTAKPEEIKGFYDEENDYAQYSFPYKNSRVTLTIVSPESRFDAPYIMVESVTKVTHEKKDPKGNVLQTSSHDEQRSYVKTLPVRINLSETKRDSKDGVLTITLAARHAKKAI